MRIIETAANLIKSDIKSAVQPKDMYPSCSDMSIEEGVAYLTGTLRVFLNVLLPRQCNEVKVASHGHALMQAVRHRVLLSPIQLGLGVHCNMSLIMSTTTSEPLTD